MRGGSRQRNGEEGQLTWSDPATACQLVVGGQETASTQRVTSPNRAVFCNKKTPLHGGVAFPMS